MNKYYEEDLPDGYRETMVVNFNDIDLGKKLMTVGAACSTVLFLVIFFAYVLPRIKEIASKFSIIKIVGLIAAYFLYVILHELTHGVVYKLVTGQKLTFGIKPPAAYCGVPDIYCYRITSLLSLFMPLTFWSIILVSAFIIVADPFIKTLILILLVLHLSGCIGDLYSIRLFFSRFKDPSTLRRDLGPKQIYYTKE